MQTRKASYRSGMFDASALTSIEAVENVTFEFEAIVNKANIERVLNDVISHERPDVVRLVLSCACSSRYVSQYPYWKTGLNDELIMDRFPTTADAFGGSLAHKVLSQLSVFFLFAQSVPTLHESHQQLVKEAPEVLAVIAAKLAADGTEPIQASSVKKVSQKKAKLARRVAAEEKQALNSGPFERLCIPVPETRQDLEQSVKIILATQRLILTVSSPSRPDAYLPEISAR
jgi:hypothetical protein